jgi:hypothetical protein
LSISNGRGALLDVDNAIQPLEAYLPMLLALPFVRKARVSAPSKSNGEPDAIVTLVTPSSTVRLAVEVKEQAVRSEVARQLAHRMSESGHRWIVFAPYVDPAAGEQLAGNGVSYVDLRGNCHVTVGDQYIARVRTPGAPARPLASTGWRPASYRVLFALLANPDAARGTARALATHAGGVSPQTAVDVRNKLTERGVLLETKGGTRWAPDRFRRGVELWTHGYTTTLAPALMVGRYRAKERDIEAMEAAIASRLSVLGTWAWGGGAACQRLTSFYRGDRTLIYLADKPAPTVANQLGLIVDNKGPLTLAHAPGPMTFSDDSNQVAHPLLVYADLLAEEHERAGEAAAVVYDQFIKPHEEQQ